MLVRWDFFHKPNTKAAGGGIKDQPLLPFSFDLEESLPLADALAYAYDQGLPKGSAQTGCVEIQNSRGIYTHKNGQRIDVSTPRKASNVIFKTWEQLEQEDEG